MLPEFVDDAFQQPLVSRTDRQRNVVVPGYLRGEWIPPTPHQLSLGYHFKPLGEDFDPKICAVKAVRLFDDPPALRVDLATGFPHAGQRVGQGRSKERFQKPSGLNLLSLESHP